MVVEYSITVTNEGGVAGYAKKIADYIPTELKFNSELNKDWYEGANGTVYNSSLANTVINPGKSKTVTLILTKNMNNDDFGVFSNSAEIYEASNNNSYICNINNGCINNNCNRCICNKKKSIKVKEAKSE